MVAYVDAYPPVRQAKPLGWDAALSGVLTPPAPGSRPCARPARTCPSTLPFALSPGIGANHRRFVRRLGVSVPIRSPRDPLISQKRKLRQWFENVRAAHQRQTTQKLSGTLAGHHAGAQASSEIVKQGVACNPARNV